MARAEDRQSRKRQGVICRERWSIRHGRSVSGIGERLEARATETAPVAGSIANGVPPGSSGMPRRMRRRTRSSHEYQLRPGRRREALNDGLELHESRPWRRAAAGCGWRWRSHSSSACCICVHRNRAAFRISARAQHRRRRAASSPSSAPWEPAFVNHSAAVLGSHRSSNGRRRCRGGTCRLFRLGRDALRAAQSPGPGDRRARGQDR